MIRADSVLCLSKQGYSISINSLREIIYQANPHWPDNDLVKRNRPSVRQMDGFIKEHLANSRCTNHFEACLTGHNIGQSGLHLDDIVIDAIDLIGILYGLGIAYDK